MNGSDIPRNEYPRPQFVRENWVNLNGTAWTYELDPGKSGVARGLCGAKGFGAVINVPFCPESKLSGVRYTDFIEEMYYHREIAVPADWSGKKKLLHFGAVDYECQGFINGREVGRHIGGSCSFFFDITDAVKPGETVHFVLRVKDNLRSLLQMGGKQCLEYRSCVCSYTRTTGIWQTVWMEAVDRHALKYCAVTPDLDNGTFHFRPELFADKRGLTLHIRVLAGGEEAGRAAVKVRSGLDVTIPLNTIRAWSPDDPFLYDVEYTLTDGDVVIDRVTSYAGLRKIHIEGDQVFLNNEKIFFRLILDQGFYPDGIWTAPSDEALKRDIETALAAGFNGARLHQKVFEERFHYWADKLGYITWGESPSWGSACFGQCWEPSPAFWESMVNFTREWKEFIRRDCNHPSILVWTPANETWIGRQADPKAVFTQEAVDRYFQTMEEVYDLTKQLDPSRPCNEASGYHHVKTDLWTVHTYGNTAEELREKLSGKEDLPVFFLHRIEKTAYKGQPYLCDEFGGFIYLPEWASKYSENSWGYNGTVISSEEEFLTLLREEIDVMLTQPDFSGYCYTQLTDVEQEQNGILTFDRVPKVELAKLKAIFGRTPRQS